MTNRKAMEIIDSMIIPVAMVGGDGKLYKPDAYREAKRKAINALEYMDERAKMHDCNDCGRDCDIKPSLGEHVRINCYHWEGKK